MGQKKYIGKQHKIIILIGESASGKDSICNEMVKNGFYRIVTHTTRPMRDNETDGIDYHFDTVDEFMSLVHNDSIIEYRTYDTVFGRWYYGSCAENINLNKHDYVIVLTPEGANSFIKYFGAENCIVFYIYAPLYLRKKRAKERGNFKIDEWERRCITDKEDFSEEKVFAVATFKINNYNRTLTDVVKTIEKNIAIWKK